MGALKHLHTWPLICNSIDTNEGMIHVIIVFKNTILLDYMLTIYEGFKMLIAYVTHMTFV